MMKESTTKSVTRDEAILETVRERYARAADTGERMCCPTGYDFESLQAFIPQEVLQISYGCGTPAGLATVQPGETVLDIGSGGGIDCFAAAQLVGPTGQVIGIDMTETMLAIARRNAPLVTRALGYPSTNVEFRKGTAEAMPVDDGRIDLIISNCVINLAPDKRKVFHEMFRIIRPGGRFTISDIVSDQAVPQYLIHDRAKWGDCLSGALTVADYMKGLVDAGFAAIHQVTCTPWQVIDGIHFLSLTLTGYKMPVETERKEIRFATLRGPFSRVVDERGASYQRGISCPVDSQTARMLATAPIAEHFVLSAHSEPLDQSDPRFQAIRPEQVPCIWEGDFAILSGPFREVADDDQHVFRRGEPLEICSKTRRVLAAENYTRHFAIINRAGRSVSGDAVTCGSEGGCC